jgi:UDP-hydrolysing UDP-N-acetyl-D-glucosamine 2-epimerase
MKNRKICVVITARPSYSRVKTLLSAINDSEKLKLQIVVSGSALINKYGSVHNFIRDDGFKIDAEVFNVIQGESIISSAKTTGIGLIEISTIFSNLKPDVVISIADRFETMATAIAASYMNIPLAHIQGGEVTGNIDEKVRHAITKLSDFHFVASKDAYDRVLKLGENEDCVFNTGCPSIDIAKSIINQKKIDLDIYGKYGGVGSFPDYSNGYWVVLQHPVTTEVNLSKKQIEETLKSVKLLNEPILWFWPNMDSGTDGTSRGLRSFREKHNLENFHFFKNFNSSDFLKLIYFSNGLIGNSSVGIRECSSLSVPVVNIGSRQNRRQRGRNVIDVDYDSNEIFSAVNKIKNSNRPSASKIYGDGNSGPRISKILEDIQLKSHKTIAY